MHDVVKRHLRYPRPQLHPGEPHARVLNQIPYEPHDLIPSDFEEVVETLRREDVHCGDATEVAPVLAVGGEHQSGVVVKEVLSGE